MREGNSAFWGFSLRFYLLPDVSSYCLTLQDKQGLDVNLLFFLFFLALHQRRLTLHEIIQIDHATAEWRRRAVQPLRAIRRDLKSGVESINVRATEALRADIKRCELHAERLQQESLERTFPPATTGAACSIQEAAAANIAAYGTLLGGLPEGPVQSLLGIFAREFTEARSA